MCGKLLPKPVENKRKILPDSSRWRLEGAVTSKTAGLRTCHYAERPTSNAAERSYQRRGRRRERVRRQ